MKKIYKAILSFIVGIVLIVSGIALGGLDDFTIFGLEDMSEFRWNAYSIDDKTVKATSQVDTLYLQIHYANVTFVESDDIDQVEVEASYLFDGFTIEERNNQIIVKQPNYRWFSKKYQSNINIMVPTGYQFDKIQIKQTAGQTNLNQLNAKTIDIKSSSANLSINNIETEYLKIDGNTCNISGFGLNVSKELSTKIVAGNAELSLEEHNSFNYDINVSMGEAEIGHQSIDGFSKDKYIDNNAEKTAYIECVMGNIEIERKD